MKEHLSRLRIALEEVSKANYYNNQEILVGQGFSYDNITEILHSEDENTLTIDEKVKALIEVLDLINENDNEVDNYFIGEGIDDWHYISEMEIGNR